MPGHPAHAARNTSGSAWIAHYVDKEPYIQVGTFTTRLHHWMVDGIIRLMVDYN